MLTDEHIYSIAERFFGDDTFRMQIRLITFARAVLAAHNASAPMSGIPQPVDASLSNSAVTLHFESAEAANRFHSCASMNIGVVQNIAEREGGGA